MPNEAEEILKAVTEFVRVGVFAEDITEELAAEGLLDSTNITFMNKFSFYYKKLVSDTRNWLCRGHKPYELKKLELLWTRDTAAEIVPYPVHEGK